MHGIWIDIDTGNFGGLSAARFFRLAERMPAYTGVMQALVMQEEKRRRAQSGGAENVIPLTPEMVQGGQSEGLEGLGGLIEFGTG